VFDRESVHDERDAASSAGYPLEVHDLECFAPERRPWPDLPRALQLQNQPPQAGAPEPRQDPDPPSGRAKTALRPYPGRYQDEQKWPKNCIGGDPMSSLTNSPADRSRATDGLTLAFHRSVKAARQRRLKIAEHRLR